jgi:hypothetical protein
MRSNSISDVKYSGPAQEKSVGDRMPNYRVAETVLRVCRFLSELLLFTVAAIVAACTVAVAATYGRRC